MGNIIMGSKCYAIHSWRKTPSKTKRTLPQVTLKSLLPLSSVLTRPRQRGIAALFREMTHHDKGRKEGKKKPITKRT